MGHPKLDLPIWSFLVAMADYCTLIALSFWAIAKSLSWNIPSVFRWCSTFQQVSFGTIGLLLRNVCFFVSKMMYIDTKSPKTAMCFVGPPRWIACKWRGRNHWRLPGVNEDSLLRCSASSMTESPAKQKKHSTPGGGLKKNICSFDIYNIYILGGWLHRCLWCILRI